MKIAVLGTRGFPNAQGGIETHCENLYPLLAARGCDITVFTRKPYVDPSIASYKGVKLVALGCFKNKFLENILHTFWGILKAGRLKPDILHIHAIGPSILTPFAKMLGMKVVVTNHGQDYERQKWSTFAKEFLRMGERVGSRTCDKVIAISETIAEDLKAKYGIEPEIIPNGMISVPKASSDHFLKDFGLEKGKYVLSVGRLVPEKGLHDLINAFIRSGISKSHGWKLVIVGRADHEDRYNVSLKALAAEDKNIFMLGFQKGETLSQLYSHQGLFVLASYHEGLPIVLLEALSYQVSCLASDIPANLEVKLSADRYFKAGDTAALSLKLQEAVSETFRSEQTTLKSTAEMLKWYCWERIASKTYAVYQKVTGSSRIRPEGVFRHQMCEKCKDSYP